MMLVDTDVLTWNLRGNAVAASLLDDNRGFSLSAVTWMELVQGVRDGAELRTLRQALHFWRATILHVDESVSARASFLVEEHALANSLQLADALIAATALESGLPLVTANDRHYRCIEGLEIRVFRP